MPFLNNQYLIESKSVFSFVTQMAFPFQWFHIMNEQMLGNHYRSMRIFAVLFPIHPNTFCGVFFVAIIGFEMATICQWWASRFCGSFSGQTPKKMNSTKKILTSTNKQSPPPTNQETNENTETAPVSVFFFGGDVSIWWIRHGIFKLRVDFQNATAEVVILESVWKDIVSKEMKCPATWQS